MQATDDTLSKEQIHELIAARKWARLRKNLDEGEPADVADVLLDLEKPDRVLLFRALSRHMGAEVFAHLDPDHQHALIEELTDKETRVLLEDLSPDDTTALLEELPGEVTRQLLSLLSPEDLKEARMLLGYPEESVGRIMTPDYVAIHPDVTVDQAIEYIRRHGRDTETFQVVYIVDKRGRLLDGVRLRRIILADPETPVKELMDERVVSLSAFQDREDAVEKMRKYDVAVLPVVDSQGILIGIVTHDDVFDVAEEEATEDIYKAASVMPLRESYRGAGIPTLYQKRIPWLSALLFVALGSSILIVAYEDTIAEVTLLAAFIPMLVAMGGNTGAQSATLMVRGLATGDLEMGDWLRALGKEVLVGVTLGVTLGIAAAGLGVVLGLYHLENVSHAAPIGAVVGLTMLSIVLVANLVGMSLPFVLARLKLDPATASAPLVTTLLDAVGILIYFTWARMILF